MRAAFSVPYCILQGFLNSALPYSNIRLTGGLDTHQNYNFTFQVANT